MEPILLTVGDAAAVLGVSRATLYDLLYRREVESVHIGRARRIPADALVAYVNRLRAGGDDQAA